MRNLEPEEFAETQKLVDKYTVGKAPADEYEPDDRKVAIKVTLRGAGKIAKGTKAREKHDRDDEIIVGYDTALDLAVRGYGEPVKMKAKAG